MKLGIDVAAREPDRPFENLQPIVDLLVRRGNHAVDDGFLLQPDGWRCRLAQAIDFDLLRATFTMPANVALSEAHDTVLDKLTWCVIEGPGARS